MIESKFNHNWWPVTFVAAGAAWLTYEGLRWSWRATVEPGPDRLLTIGVALFLLLAALYLACVVLRDALTHLSDEGVSRPTIRGRRFFRWRDLQRIESRGYSGRLVFTNGAFILNLLLFKDPSTVAAFIRQKLPPDAYIKTV